MMKKGFGVFKDYKALVLYNLINWGQCSSIYRCKRAHIILYLASKQVTSHNQNKFYFANIEKYDDSNQDGEKQA